MTFFEACVKYTGAAITFTILNQFLGALCFNSRSGFATEVANKSANVGCKLHDLIERNLA